VTQEQKDEILKLYLQWVDQVCDDCEDKEYFYPEEIVMKVLSLAEEYFE
jgi:hypothetical protein